MKERIAIVMAVALMAAAGVAAQQSLGDVAGSIKLKRPQGEPVVIDSSSVSQVRPRSGSSRGSSELEDVMGGCAETSRNIATLLEDMPLVSPVSYPDDFRERLADAAFRLDNDRRSLALFYGVEGVREMLDAADRGIAEVQQALEAAQTAVAGARLLSIESRKLASHGAQLVEDALSDLRRTSRKRSSTATPPTIDPIAADASIRDLCGRSYAEDSDRYRQCVARQQAAISSIQSRSGLAAGLDEAAFNTIRNQCRFEWPHDFVARDGCERRRVANAGGS
jgi:hypothetical protein